MKDINLMLVVIIGVLQVLDVLTTEKILGAGGTELNPVMHWLFDKCGMQDALVVKALFVIILAILADAFVPIALIPIAIMYTGVVGWNLYQIRKMK